MLGEIVQLDSAPNVERRGACVANQVGGARSAQQAKGQSIESCIRTPSVVALAYGGEKFIRREWQAADDVDLVHEDDKLVPGPWSVVRGRGPVTLPAITCRCGH